ncbi:MAG: DUF177 domain-containing protein [Flavobacteriaceae bacterium]|nr:DUF177 domain-containing protein [Flavobacteriaceae bacterium]
MKNNKEYVILFKGLKIGIHQFEYKINKKFFDSFTYSDFIDTNVKVHLELIKKNTLLELFFKLEGTVRVNCDVSGEEYNQPIFGKLNIIVKYGKKYNNDDEVILILPYGEFELDVAQYIYEIIILSTPSKRVHPGVIDKTLKSDILDKLEEFKSTKNKKEKTDPRWDQLKKLLTGKNI